MSRCVMVLSAPRSGSSAVSGVLHYLGVNMGEGHLGKGNAWNERGYYEDHRWQALNKQITGDRYGHNQPAAISQRQAAQYKTLAKKCAASPLWGMKDPRLCFTAQFVWPWLKDVRVVAVEREREAAAASLLAHSRGNYKGRFAMTPTEAQDLTDLWIQAREDRLRQFRGPVLRVRYENLVSRPNEVVGDLAAFAFHGMRSPAPDRRAAVAFIDPELRHHG